MDKIKIKQSLENADLYKSLWKIEMKLNDLIEGYNELNRESMENNTSINDIMEWIRKHKDK